MPIYEFQCEACGSRFEKIISSSVKDAEIKCPQCGQNKSKKQFSMFAARTQSASGGSSVSRPRFT